MSCVITNPVACIDFFVSPLETFVCVCRLIIYKLTTTSKDGLSLSNSAQALKPKRILGVLAFALLLTACSDRSAEYIAQIEKLEERIKTLETQGNEVMYENKDLKEMYRRIQPADVRSRGILYLIGTGDFETLKERHGLELNINETKDEVTFDDNVMKRKLALPIKFFDINSAVTFYDLGMQDNDFWIVYDVWGNEDVNIMNSMRVTFTYDEDTNLKSMDIFEKVQ